MSRIVAVVVFYQMALAESPTYRTLSTLLQERGIGPDVIELKLVDNSPQRQEPPPAHMGCYEHDGTNAGLARRYNQALAAAQRSGAEWLLLLDQDTALTAGYLEELLDLSTAVAKDGRIGAVVPKLMEGGKVQSPHWPQFSRADLRLDENVFGPMAEKLRIYNSGAMIRTTALRAIGGFPESYWLDYLDHATFQKLHDRGYSVFVMRAKLAHEMSIHRADRFKSEASLKRLENQLAAQSQFYGEFGTARERMLFRLSLAKRFVRSVAAGRLAESARVGKALTRLMA